MMVVRFCYCLLLCLCLLFPEEDEYQPESCSSGEEDEGSEGAEEGESIVTPAKKKVGVSDLNVPLPQLHTSTATCAKKGSCCYSKDSEVGCEDR